MSSYNVLDSVLFPQLQTQLAAIGSADILVGIPCYNNVSTIPHVMAMVSVGLAQHYPHQRAVILLADGGSTDGTPQQTLAPAAGQTQLVTACRGIGGKGSALRTVFAAAATLDVRACVTVDADLRSITPAWMHHLLTPLLDEGYDFVAPLYARHKYDGTITNNLVYCLTRALYGQRIRQPIGGDFGLSGALARHYLHQPVWETDVARFGIDIWMTLEAIATGAGLCQTHLGVKLHDPKDPASALGPMFEQVSGTLFRQIERDVEIWQLIRGSQAVATFGADQGLEPEPVAVDYPRMVQAFRAGFDAWQPLYRQLLAPSQFGPLQRAATGDGAVTPQLWARLLYDLLVAYHHLQDHRGGLIRAMVPLYLGRVATFVAQTRDLDAAAAEAEVAALAQQCEAQKPYLLERWGQRPEPLTTEVAKYLDI